MCTTPSRNEVLVAKRTTVSTSLVCFVSPSVTPGSFGRSAGTGLGQLYGFIAAGAQLGSACTAGAADADAASDGVGWASFFVVVQPASRTAVTATTAALLRLIGSG